MLWLSPIVALLFLSLVLVTSLEQCAESNGGGFCPDGNTCCSTAANISGCISNNMGSLSATCCGDGLSGCPKGYKCIADGRCEATPSRPLDPLLLILNRYTLCPGLESLYQVYGLAIPIDETDTVMLPYYSSHGSLTSESTDLSNVELAVVVVHGGGRNADDYYCPLLEARKLQQQYPPDSVLVLAPRFITNQDLPLDVQGATEPSSILRFPGLGHGEWRYGAAAEGHSNFTSFDALDRMVDLLHTHPNMKQMVVVGHSVGAQFVHRWSLLTHWSSTHRLRAVVANPSSWTYLSPERYIQNSWQVPSSTSKCPYYNEWAWGLENSDNFTSPYKDRVIHEDGISGIVDKYRHRDVVYLSGSLDRCNVTGTGKWCQSHDLGVSCADELQGRSRRERHRRFVESLRTIGIHHSSHVVDGVGHDHALIFTSPIGLSVLFPRLELGEYDSTTSKVASSSFRRRRRRDLGILFRLTQMFVNGRMAFTRSLMALFPFH